MEINFIQKDKTHKDKKIKLIICFLYILSFFLLYILPKHKPFFKNIITINEKTLSIKNNPAIRSQNENHMLFFFTRKSLKNTGICTTDVNTMQCSGKTLSYPYPLWFKKIFCVAYTYIIKFSDETNIQTRSKQSQKGISRINTSFPYLFPKIFSGTIGPFFISHIFNKNNSNLKVCHFSEDTKSTTKEVFLPPPSGLSATGGRKIIELVWDKYTHKDIRGYHIYRGQNSGGPYKLISSQPYFNNRFFDMETILNQTYFYVICVEDVYGNKSDFSSEVSARSFKEQIGKFKSLGEVTELTARIDRGAIILTWEEIMDDCVFGYIVLRRQEDSESDFEKVSGKTPLKWPFFGDGNVEDDINYTYSIIAVDSFGNESIFSKEISTIYSSLFITDFYLSDSTRSFIYKGNDELTLTLKGTRDVNAYFDIEGIESHIHMKETENPGVYVASYKIPLDIKNNQFSFIGFLEDDRGRSTFKVARDRLRIDNVPPPPPIDLKATLNLKTLEIYLSWNISDDTNDIESLKLYRASSDIFREIVSRIPKNVQNYIDTSIATGTDYQYKMTTIDMAGNESLPSEIVDITVPIDKIPPEILTMGIINDKGIWRIGDTISIFIIGESECSAEFFIGEKMKNIPMIQINKKGRYEGKYLFSLGDTGKDLLIKGMLIDQSGNISYYESGIRITIIPK